VTCLEYGDSHADVPPFTGRMFQFQAGIPLKEQNAQFKSGLKINFGVLAKE